MSVDYQEREINVIETIRRLKERKAAEEIDGGFTLIELLIVIVVLGILAAVVVFSLGGVSGQSAQAACKSDGATLNTALAAWQANNSGGTATQADLLGSGGTVYVQSWPSNGTHYAYSISAGGALELAVPSTGTPAPYSVSACDSVS